MSDSPDLFGKADALLGRYRGEARADPDYPVLTEVVESPAPSGSVSPEQGPATSPPLDEPAVAETRRLTDVQLAELQSRMFERLAPSIGALVDAAFAEAWQEKMEEQLRRALQELTIQVKAELEAQLREQLADAIRNGVASLREPGEAG
jgi:cytochrome P450